ncbi:hypothetical protein ABZO31_31390 [Streptomyces sp. HUAS MG47]|uniref:hypothetical protein n=1 Tax=Streptomyces solicamelliae TaxID=3231716 RepID=UPI003877EC84
MTVVGGAAIDRTPAPAKDFAVRTFGESDKNVLLLGPLAVLALVAIGPGLPAVRRPRAGAAALYFLTARYGPAAAGPAWLPHRGGRQMKNGSYETLPKSTLTTEGSGERYTVDETSKVVCGNVPTANATIYSSTRRER